MARTIESFGATRESPSFASLPDGEQKICFVLGRRRAILPAFGRMTGLAIVAPSPDETVVAIAGRDLFRLPG